MGPARRSRRTKNVGAHPQIRGRESTPHVFPPHAGQAAQRVFDFERRG
jgi:hypothetical protein